MADAGQSRFLRTCQTGCPGTRLPPHAHGRATPSVNVGIAHRFPELAPWRGGARESSQTELGVGKDSSSRAPHSRISFPKAKPLRQLPGADPMLHLKQPFWGESVGVAGVL